MAAAAAASRVISLTHTRFLPSLTQPLITPKSLSLHPYGFRIPQAKLNASTWKDELGDERYMYNNEMIDRDEESDEEEDDDDTESSIDLLFRFLQSMFKKASKRVRKASRSILPAVIPPQLVTFDVDGVLLLACLSILKAFLEVACTIGGTVFVVILLIRVILAAISYFQSNQNDFNQNGPSYGRKQTAS